MLRDELYAETVRALASIEAEVKGYVTPAAVRTVLAEIIRDGLFETSLLSDSLVSALVPKEVRHRIKRVGQVLIWVMDALRAHGLEVTEHPAENGASYIRLRWRKVEDNVQA